jgi:hypothetical protein
MAGYRETENGWVKVEEARESAWENMDGITT